MAIRRNYITTSDVSGATEAQAALAEEIIDQYVGYQTKAVEPEFRGTISAVSGSNKTFADTNPTSQLRQRDGYFTKCVLEIIGGTGAAQSALITGSSYDNQTVTIATAFDTTPDTTSFFRIYQLAKFPRSKDSYQTPNGLTYYRTIPEAVKQATLAQLAYIVELGNGFFTDDSADAESESIGNYSYSGANSMSATVRMVAPKARLLLRGIMNRTGRLVAGDE